MIFEYYLIFSITTALSIVWLNWRAKILAGIEDATIIFYIISFMIAFLFSPVFFLIFIFQSEQYMTGIAAAMVNTYK
jgi:hypothetical protein